MLPAGRVPIDRIPSGQKADGRRASASDCAGQGSRVRGGSDRDDASHNDGDVIFATPPIGLRDQAFARSLRIALFLQNGSDLFFGNHRRKTIGTEQQHIVGMEIEAVQFDLNSPLRATKNVGHDMPPRMPCRLFG